MNNLEWKIVYTKQALKDKRKAVESGYSEKIKNLLKIVRVNPYEEYPPYEKFIGDLCGSYSRRINHQHRFVYQVYKEENTIKVISLWTHYE